MLAVSLALIACLNWGISGFLAGMKSRVMPVLTLLLFSSMAGVGMFLISVGVRGVQLPRDPNLLYAVLGGAVGMWRTLLLLPRTCRRVYIDCRACQRVVRNAACAYRSRFR